MKESTDSGLHSTVLLCWTKCDARGGRTLKIPGYGLLTVVNLSYKLSQIHQTTPNSVEISHTRKRYALLIRLHKVKIKFCYSQVTYHAIPIIVPLLRVNASAYGYWYLAGNGEIKLNSWSMSVRWHYRMSAYTASSSTLILSFEV